MAATNWKASISFEARVLYDASKLVMGDEYEPTVGMQLIGDNYNGWQGLVYLEVQFPDSSDVLSETVNIREIGLKEFRDFPFATFTAPSGYKKMIMLKASTKQEDLLNSTLIINHKVKIADGKYTSPLYISWNLEFKMEYDAQALTPQSTYQFIVPLMLKGESLQGWSEPVNVEVVLPGGKKIAQTLDPENIPLNKFMEVATRHFVAPKSDQKITITVSTTQGSNLHSMLLVGDVKHKLY